MRLLKKIESKPPPIFADVVVEAKGESYIFNVEVLGWLEAFNEMVTQADRVGLQIRGSDIVSFWVGAPCRYFSRVIGNIGPDGHSQRRVACLEVSGVRVWLNPCGVIVVRN